MSSNARPTIKGARGLSAVLACTTALIAPGLLVGFASVVAPTAALAQDFTNGTLVGYVTDVGSKPIAGATVAVTSKSRGFRNTYVTDAKGRFTAPQLAVGDYTVAVSKSGYESLDAQSVQVTLGGGGDYRFALSSSGATEVAAVVIKGTRREGIDFDRATTGAVIKVDETVDRLPVSRDIGGILALVPTVQRNETFGQPSISGSSPAENIFYINGFNLTNTRSFLGAGTVPFNFYSQIDVKTGGLPAEFGRNTGGAVIAVTKSGSNEFHGGFDAYVEPVSLRKNTKNTGLNWDNLANKNFHDNKHERVNNYESDFWLSGPILPDHVFFYGFYNPRHKEDTTYTTGTPDGATSPIRNRDLKTSPFYGGKLDINLTSKQRVEYTYFHNDDTKQVQQLNGTDLSNSQSIRGGEVKIVKYTGNWTDWFTLSALYGRSNYGQTDSGSLDGQAAVFLNGSLVRGNPNLLIAKGADFRENYRVDADLYFNAMGRHHVRLGVDHEQLVSRQIQSYSGGIYYRYYGPGTNCGGSGVVTDNCVRVRDLGSGGSFNTEQSAWYVEDSYDPTDRLSFQFGLRNEDFDNRNSANVSFINIKNNLAPRIAATYDVTGDRSTKLTAYYGRTYLPLAGNLNIRGSGGEHFFQDYYIWTSRNATTLVPVLGTNVASTVLEDGLVPDPKTIASHNLEPQNQDEYSLGLEHKFDNGWKFGVSVTYRKLNAVTEDADTRYNAVGGAAGLCTSLGLATCGTFGNGGYVVINPGKAVVITLGPSFGADAGKVVTIPKGVLGEPAAKREYKALEFTASRAFDGVWGFDGSYILSRGSGNYEGGVKTDLGQADTGGTQDFDEPGYMYGSGGVLPNDHTHQFKAHLTYAPMKNLIVGVTGNLLSPREYGCLGYYPTPADGSGSNNVGSWYCGSKLTPRGSQFSGDWIRTLDLSMTYTLPKFGMVPGSAKVHLDIFNVFNFQDVTTYQEVGETALNTRQNLYSTPVDYQTPRYVRFGLNYAF
jgi:hypothetical protein